VPERPVVGKETTVTFATKEGPRAGVELRLVRGEESRVIGTTNDQGQVVFVPKRAGSAEIRAEVAGVEHLVSIVVQTPHSVFGWIVPWLIVAIVLVYAQNRCRSRFLRYAIGCNDS